MNDCPYMKCVCHGDSYDVLCTIKEYGGCGCIHDPDTGHNEDCPENSEEQEPP